MIVINRWDANIWNINRLNGANLLLLKDTARTGECGTISTRSGFTVAAQTYVMNCGGVIATAVKIQLPGREYLPIAEVNVRGKAGKIYFHFYAASTCA